MCQRSLPRRARRHPMLKLYVVVRGDLPAADQAVQAAHAVADFATDHSKEFRAWNTGNNTLILLEARDEKHLRSLAVQAEDGGFKHTRFVEPDYKYVRDSEMMPNTLTAVAFAPDWTVQNVILADLPLALPAKRGWSWLNVGLLLQGVMALGLLAVGTHWAY